MALRVPGWPPKALSMPIVAGEEVLFVLVVPVIENSVLGELCCILNSLLGLFPPCPGKRRQALQNLAGELGGGRWGMGRNSQRLVLCKPTLQMESRISPWEIHPHRAPARRQELPCSHHILQS